MALVLLKISNESINPDYLEQNLNIFKNEISIKVGKTLNSPKEYFPYNLHVLNKSKTCNIDVHIIITLRMKLDLML